MSDRIFGDRAKMAASSPRPAIKIEPQDHYSMNQFGTNQSGYSMPDNFEQQYTNAGNSFGDVDPHNLGLSDSWMQAQFGPQQNMSSSFTMGGAGIADDELADLGNLNDTGVLNFNAVQNGYGTHQGNFGQPQSTNPSFVDLGSVQGGPVSMGHQDDFNQMYSHTPEGAPIQSPFIHGFNYAQFRPTTGQHKPSFTQARPSMDMRHNSFNVNSRPSMAGLHMERAVSDSRSPLTPKTDALGALHLGTPESLKIQGQAQPIHRHQTSLSSHWSGGAHSLDSPSTSPNTQQARTQISEVLKSGKHASLPTKVDTAPPYQSVEAKRRRRRESHNLVERRRRDNINERIQDLAHVIPQHRLEDDRLRKALANGNSPLSPSVAALGISPPHATSLLAGGNGRRATTVGPTTQGFPADEKDKGPNKGEILNGAVSLMSDLIWYGHWKIQEKAEMIEEIERLGGTWRPRATEEVKRMETEILDIVEKNDPSSFQYSRGPGSGLRVPDHTTLTGDPLPDENPLSPQSLSPGDQLNGDSQYWAHNGSGEGIFKEEDEFAMEMN